MKFKDMLRKKKKEEKQKNVANITEINKFLRIYYSKVVEIKQENHELKIA